jgi:S-formylglutathione hydrolase
MSGPSELEILSEQRCFGGTQIFARHGSQACAGPMRFSVYLPPDVSAKAPCLFYLAGLSCNEETFFAKAGAQRVAAELGMVLVACDTSPRTLRFDGDDEHWDFGLGAGFYLDATAAPWSQAYRMESYVTQELTSLVLKSFPVDAERIGIFGHSMGGHGALTLALKHPQLYRSVSAFAPIVAPSQVPWGEKALSRYLGSDREAWLASDACHLVRARPRPGSILIDQGLADKFLEPELKPELFEAACKSAGQSLDLRRHVGYDHSYYFIQSVIADHLHFHAKALA